MEVFPAWSPDGRRIAFAVMEKKQIVVVNADGSDERQLTVQGSCEDPTWSPDGSQIAFQSSRDGDFEIYTVNVEEALRGEGSARQLTDNRAGDFWPSWGPAANPTTTASSWFKTYGGPRDDVGWGILAADDGGYYIVGTTGLEFEPQRRANVYLIRTDAAGEVLWEKKYERDGYTEGAAISWADDGNLLISGPAILSTTNGTDIYLLKVDPAGNELWFRTFGGPLDEMGTAWPQEDGGFLLAGNSIDPNDIVADPGAAGYGGMAGRSSVYLAQFAADGTERWSRTYGGENNVMVFDGLQTPDGGMLLLATIMYYPENDDDIYLLKVDADGNEVWSRTWEEGMAEATGLVLTNDGNYLLAGSYSPPEVMDREKRDFLFIQIDPQGNEIWKKVWGDPEAGDDAAMLAATADGGSIAVGDTGGDLSSWSQDIALLKLDAQGQQLWRQVIATQSHQMYGQVLQHPDGGYLLVGSLVSDGQFDIFLIKTDAQGYVQQP